MKKTWLLIISVLCLLLSSCWPAVDSEVFAPLDGSGLASISQTESETIIKAQGGIFSTHWAYEGEPVEGCESDPESVLSFCIRVSADGAAFFEDSIPVIPERVSVVFTTPSGVFECRNFGTENNCSLNSIITD